MVSSAPTMTAEIGASAISFRITGTTGASRIGSAASVIMERPSSVRPRPMIARPRSRVRVSVTWLNMM